MCNAYRFIGINNVIELSPNTYIHTYTRTILHSFTPLNQTLKEREETVKPLP